MITSLCDKLTNLLLSKEVIKEEDSEIYNYGFQVLASNFAGFFIVFDADIFEEKVKNFDDVVAFGENNNILGISNPAFELFLLLHYKDAYEKYIKPNEKEIISNEKVGNQRYIRNLFTQVSGINPKKNKSIGELVKQVDFAIVEECKINEDIHQCSGQVTCNIAKIINDIRNNKAI